MLGGIAAHAVFVAPHRLRITEVDLFLPALPSAFAGYRMAIVADLHTGMPGSVAQARRAFDAVQRATPDLIVLLGDFGFSYRLSRAPSRLGYGRSMRLLTPMLRELNAPDGVAAVLGNHDYYFDADAVSRWLQAWGIRVLRNERIELEREQARLALLGVEDAREGRADVARAAAGLSPDVPRILLSHTPDGCYVIGDTRVDVVLAGHTHGGQIVLPYYGAPLRFCRICGRHTASGWVPNEYAPLYVTTGVGGMIPLRVNAPPEIVIATLRRGGADQQDV